MRLVIVSNRVAVPDQNEKAAAGGLAVALREALEARGGLWFGWSGEVSDKPGAPKIVERGNVTYAVTDLTEDERRTYYLGFSNRALWPNMHYRLGLTEFTRDDYAGYLAVNRRFAKLLAGMLEPDDVVWIHDYHLLPLAAALRKRGVRNRIGYFHHIPWPPSEVFGALPAANELMKSLGAYDLIGVQTEIDARNVVSGFVYLCGAEPIARGVRMGHREVTIQAFPIGIDAKGFARMSARAAKRTPSETRRATEAFGDRKLVIGVDRLDYSKGIIQRLEAFERYMLDHPEERGKVGMLQIAPPSRSEVPEYAELDRQSDETAGRINAALGDFDWMPLRVVKKAYSRKELAGFYRRSQVGLVTPMRDGMNLVAKEYVAAQNPADPGVLVLSRFAGAARQMTDALIVNPYDLSDMAEAIHRALTMPKEERISRHERLLAGIASRDIDWWTQAYLDALTNAPDRLEEIQSAPTGRDTQRGRAGTPYRSAQRISEVRSAKTKLPAQTTVMSSSRLS